MTFLCGGHRREVQLLFGALSRPAAASRNQRRWTWRARDENEEPSAGDGRRRPGFQSAPGFRWFPPWFKTFLVAWSVLFLFYAVSVAICFHYSQVAARASAPAPPKIPALVSGCRAWENSLGMRFRRVNRVLFCVWKTRLQDFEHFARQAGDGLPEEWRQPGFPQEATHPVVQVNWEEANAFCRWLTRKERGEGLLEAGQYYRLPTDAEWDEAAGLARDEGEVQVSYSWGQAWPPPSSAGNFAVVEDGYRYTSPVGSFQPNHHGLYDMGGNAWEWCLDAYDGQADSHIVRGGSWDSVDRDSLALGYRGLGVAGRRASDRGFRCVLDDTGLAGSSGKSLFAQR